MIWVQLQSLTKLSRRCFHIAFQSQSEPEVVVIFRISRIQFNRVLQILHRGGEVSSIRQYLPQSEIYFGLLGRELTRRP